MKVAIITAIVNHELEDMTEKELEVVIKVYLKADDIPFCQRIESVKVVSQNELSTH